MVSTYLTGEDAAKHVPDEFWSETLQQALLDSLDEYEKFKDAIDPASFLKDFVSCLVPLALKQEGNAELLDRVYLICSKNMSVIGP